MNKGLRQIKKNLISDYYISVKPIQKLKTSRLKKKQKEKKVRRVLTLKNLLY